MEVYLTKLDSSTGLWVLKYLEGRFDNILLPFAIFSLNYHSHPSLDPDLGDSFSLYLPWDTIFRL